MYSVFEAKYSEMEWMVNKDKNSGGGGGFGEDDVVSKPLFTTVP